MHRIFAFYTDLVYNGVSWSSHQLFRPLYQGLGFGCPQLGPACAAVARILGDKAHRLPCIFVCLALNV